LSQAAPPVARLDAVRTALAFDVGVLAWAPPTMVGTRSKATMIQAEFNTAFSWQA